MAVRVKAVSIANYDRVFFAEADCPTERNFKYRALTNLGTGFIPRAMFAAELMAEWG